jgi:hypothetical protein
LAFGAAAGAAGAPGAGAGVWACAAETTNVADIAVAANKAKTRPCGTAKIRKFIAENPF